MNTLILSDTISPSDQFTHLMFLISIVVGMAITTLIQGFASFMKNRKNLIGSLTLYLWMASNLIVGIQAWFNWWIYRGVDNLGFTFVMIGFLANLPILFMAYFLVPDLSSPEVQEEMKAGKYSLKSYFFRNAAWFFTIGIIEVITLGFWNWYCEEIIELNIVQTFHDKIGYRIIFLLSLGGSLAISFFQGKKYPESKQFSQPWRATLFILALAIFFLLIRYSLKFVNSIA